MASTSLQEPVAVVRLRRHLTGYSLELEKGDRAVVADLYGVQSVKDLKGVGKAPRLMGHGQPLQEVLEGVLRTAEDLGYKVTVCGDRRRAPVLRVRRPQTEVPVALIPVSLGASLWSDCAETWEAHSPGLWSRLDAAFRGVGPGVGLVCYSEDGFAQGRVVVKKGKAEVNMVVFPRETPKGPAPETVPEDDIMSWFEGCVGTGVAGAQASGVITARRFATLMRRLDNLAWHLQNEVAAVCHLACSLPKGACPNAG